jgi:hypothetical protein
MVPGDGTEVLQRCGEYTYRQGELRGRVGKERGGKEIDRCPLTLARYVLYISSFPYNIFTLDFP